MPPKASTCGILCMDQREHLSFASMIRKVASSKNVDTLIARIYYSYVNVNSEENNNVDYKQQATPRSGNPTKKSVENSTLGPDHFPSCV